MRKKIIILISMFVVSFLLSYFLYNSFNSMVQKLFGKPKSQISCLKEDNFLYASPNHKGIGMDSTVLYGYINNKGLNAIGYKFVRCQDYFEKNTFAWIQDKNTLYGYINYKGEVKVAPKYLYASRFINNYALIKENKDTYSFISIENDEVVPISSDIIPNKIQLILLDDFKEDYEDKIANKEGSISFASKEKLSKSGQVLKALKVNDKKVSGYIYTKIKKSSSNEISVSNGKQTFFVNNKGKLIKNLPKIKGDGVLKHCGNLILVNKNDIYSYITKSGIKVWKEKDYIQKFGNYRIGQKTINKIIYPIILSGSSKKSVQDINGKLHKCFVTKLSNVYSVNFKVEVNKDLLIAEKITVKYRSNGTQLIKSDVYHFNIKNGHQYKINSMFKNKKKFNTAYKNILHSKMNSKEIDIPVNAEKNLPNVSNFKLEKNNIKFIIHSGDFEKETYIEKKITVLYGDVEGIVNKNSEIWKSFNKNILTEESLKNSANNCVKGYIENFSPSVNEYNFSKIEPYLYKDDNPNSLYTIQKKLLDYFKGQNIKEDLTSYNIVNIINKGQESDEFKFEAYSEEVFKINTDNKSVQEKKFNWVYSMVYNSENKTFYLSDIRAWDPNTTNNNSSGKVVYLTFDDGPNDYTPKILDMLKPYNYKATFFMLSFNMQSNVKILTRMSQEGHELALHGAIHEYKEVYKDDYSVVNSMNTANNILKNIIGFKSYVCRVPYGTCSGMNVNQLRNLRAQGYRVWDWDIDSQDSLNSKVTPEHVADTTINSLNKLQNGAVILMHDKKVTTDALPKILSYINSNGYIVKTLPSDTVGKSFLK
jgi:peptidoglycan-N-acetylglucosamine deacetylase